MDWIDTIILVVLVVVALTYWRNTVLELRKLNKEFNKFYRWIYHEGVEAEKQDEKPENKKKEMNPRLKDFLTKGKLW